MNYSATSSPSTEKLLYCAFAIVALGSAAAMWVSQPKGANHVDMARFTMLIGFMLVSIASLVLAHLGHRRSATLVLVVLVWLGITAFVVVTGLGLHSSVLFLYLPAIVFTALLCSAQAAVAHTAATIAVLWGLWHAEETGRLPGVRAFAEGTTNFNFTVGVSAACIATLLLAATFQYLMARAHTDLARAHSQESAANQALRLAASGARAYAWEWDIPGDRLTWLTPPVQLLGPLPASGRYPQFRDMVHPDDRSQYAAQSRAFAAAGEEYERDFRLVRTDGEVRWLHGRGRAFRDARGRPLRMVGVTVDIDERKQRERQIVALTEELERRVAARTGELETAVRDLKAVSYSVSHDLRAPLRAIHAYASLLRDESVGHAEEAADWLKRITSNAAQMSLMVDALVKLIRVTSGPLLKQPVDLHGIATALASAARQRVPAARISVKAMPSAHGDAELLAEVLAALIDNALKFIPGGAAPTVDIGWDVNHEAWFVRDQGIGIDMAHAAHIWGLFDRLHPTEVYAGVGAGLAVVQRVVERHAGQVWVESAPGAGATFFFALPKGKPEAPV
jgi:signal transduction histidine kinase